MSKKNFQLVKKNMTTDSLPERLLANRYQLKKLVGKGYMGEIYRAKDIYDGNTVAVKILSRAQLNLKMLERFGKIAAISTLLGEKSSQIVSIRDYGLDENGTPFYVMELLEGTSMKEIIKSPLELPQFLNLIRQICWAIKTAHNGIVFEGEMYPIIHQDIKPSNIFILNNQLVKVLDFGIADLLKADKSQSKNFIEPQYCSPEQLQGKKLDNRSDIYSLGVIMYEMMAKELPFQVEDMSWEAWGKAHQELQPKAWEIELNWPEELKGLIMKCLAKRAGDRPQSVGEILQVIETIERSFNQPTEKVENQFEIETEENPFLTEIQEVENQFETETEENPFSTEEVEKLFETETEENPFSTEEGENLFETEEEESPFSTEVEEVENLFETTAEESPFSTEVEEVEKLFETEEKEIPFSTITQVSQEQVEEVEKLFETKEEEDELFSEEIEEKEKLAKEETETKDNRIIEEVYLQSAWPKDKPLQKIVFPCLTNRPEGVMVSIWAMLECEDIINRMYNLRHSHFLFQSYPHPMVLWITLLYSRKQEPRWLPCYLDLKTKIGQDVVRNLAEATSYHILLFAKEEPQQCQHIMNVNIRLKQCNMLKKWADVSNTLIIKKREEHIAKQMLKDKLEQTKQEILQELGNP